MTLRNKMWGLAVAGLFAMTSVSTAAAQDPEAGDTGQWQQPQGGGQQQGGGWQQQQQQQPPQGGWQQQPPQGGGQQAGWGAQNGGNEAPPSGGGAEAPDASVADSDHTAAVGHLGVGWFGVSGVQLGVEGMTTVPISAPAVGIRYWLSQSIGLDLALGFGYGSTGGTVDSPAGLTDVSVADGFALTIHGGLPVSLYQGKHYSFQIVPELDLGFGSGTAFGLTPNDDENLGGFLFRIGARAGAEVYFGFIGVPQLALQATVGLAFAYQSGSVENDLGNAAGSTITSISTISLATTVQEEPWDIFTGSIRAIYYWE
jgi:hypothetical protein